MAVKFSMYHSEVISRCSLPPVPGEFEFMGLSISGPNPGMFERRVLQLILGLKGMGFTLKMH